MSSSAGKDIGSRDILCIYHKDCNDGLAAAAVVVLYAQQEQREIDCTACHHGDPLPDTTGYSFVIIVDFSFSRKILVDLSNKLTKRRASLKVIDHHKTAEEDLWGLPFCIFDMNECGATLAWKTFFPDKEMPLLLRYVRDRDLWLWELNNSRAVLAGLNSIDTSLGSWVGLLKAPSGVVDNLLAVGLPIYGYQRKLAETIAKRAWTCEIAGHLVPCVNTTTLISEVGEILCEENPFSVTYFDTAQPGTGRFRLERVHSLRSKPGSLVDVGEIAKMFGGGGHKHAAGFKINCEILDYNLLEKVHA